MDKRQLRSMILDKINRPQIPDRLYSVLDFGAVPDGQEIQTEALQRAIDKVSAAGGGRVVVPAGKYRTGALRLKSGVELHLESRDTMLSFVSKEPELHYPVVFSHWEATPCCNYSPLLYACDAQDIAVTGPGTLDGGADKDHWWDWHHQVENAWSENRPDLQLEDRKILRNMNQDGVPVSERVFGPGHYLRPNFVQPIRCKRVLFQGFTLKNSPMWQLNPVMCESLTVDGVTMSSHGANNDGCDPESCSGVWIKNCRFDTGDDCISLKSGRDRDGREANKSCEYVLIENNEFADGHGGIALGSEMSGGIRYVLAQNNRFSSPNLTYALRLKTNARRGGQVEDVILADSVMDHVHGAAVHGTMLYEDGRNGDYLPVFKNITIEDITAHGGDYGVFLEAFEEVPITGLILRNITIDGVTCPMRSMNWEDPVMEQVQINGKNFPRPGKVRILAVPEPKKTVSAALEYCGGTENCRFAWEVSENGTDWSQAGEGETCTVPETARFIRVTACDRDENREMSRSYRVLQPLAETSEASETDGRTQIQRRLICRGMLAEEDMLAGETAVTRERLARMMQPLLEESKAELSGGVLQAAVKQGFLALDSAAGFYPEGLVSRQEMATVAMQACGVNYRNASSTMPVCRDAGQVSNNYGTNVARALYFGFLELDEKQYFYPERPVTVEEAERILDRVADFAGI